jgi:hypothetical protein
MQHHTKSAATQHAHECFTNSQQPARRWLFPREHGAYAQLGFPLITALALGGPSAAAWCWVITALTIFLAHEPVLILAGERGRRTRAQLAPRARSTAVLLLGIAVGAGVLGWWLAPRNARFAVLAPIALGTILVPLILSHREKTLIGELLASITFASMAIPVALAGGASGGAALVASIVWGGVFSLSTLTVRATIGRVKRITSGRRACYVNLTVSALALGAAILLTATETLPAAAAAGIVPAALIAAVCSIVEVHTRHLRALGWSLVGSNVFTLVALLAGLR